VSLHDFCGYWISLIISSANDAMIQAARPQIELRNLHRVFDATHAVNDVSFEVYAGEVFGYIGPNGAGKTTSMRILATLDEPTTGDAFVDGFSVVDDPDRVRRRLGFMPDYFGTYQNVSVTNTWISLPGRMDWPARNG
jgi:ABC-2 type transport system ATP-binding protein